ncbi:preprotein translocase subunit YajC [Streptomyces seoulensis]|uniref:Preprotein translocase subunit YajC n=1 Tax=Streptomyces seoulensis TaxID=73044 RepID=A0A4P6TSM3_STRSO|nr:preprotein translocase subunit YajC [Streptomyces seoulensis]QBJ89633.1 preprotein translocase subunit YajC [Streptomyces seoulensis]
MNVYTLLPFIVLIAVMFLMTRSAKKKQQQAANMRNEMQPGSGVRTIGGMYATVKEVTEDTVLLDAGPGVELIFAKNAIGAVLSDDEYNRIIHGIEHDLKSDSEIVPDDASSLTAADAEHKAVDFGKKDAAEETPVAEDKTPADKAGTVEAAKDDTVVNKAEAAEPAEAPKKTDGDTDAK